MLQIYEDPEPAPTVEATPDEEAPAWETCKENAQPLRRGRKAEALSERLEKGPAPSDTEETARNAFEGRVRDEASSEDPLAPWCEYVRWQQDTCVTGDGVLPLLERCTHAFKDDARYTDDARYLKMWTSYADLVRDPEPLFEFMNDRYIGVTQSHFWEAWAAALEAKGKPEAADKAYTNGILMRAQPAKRLERAHREFQGRLMKKIMSGAAAGSGAGAGAAAAAGGGRSAAPKDKERKTLNRLTKKEAAPGAHRPTTERAAAPLAAPKAKSSGVSTGNFMIFCDDAPEENTGGGSGREVWETGTMTENSKENSGMRSTWNEPLNKPKKKRQPVPPSAPSHPDFEIHFDEEFAADDAAEEGAAERVVPVRLQLAGPSLQVSREIESLQSNPLARFVEAGDAVDVSDSRPAPAPVDENSENAAPSNGLRMM